jgi:hypothetical protein
LNPHLNTLYYGAHCLFVFLFGSQDIVLLIIAGFLSIDCGGKTDYTDLNNIRWVTDADYIDHLGETADIGNATDDPMVLI